MNLVALNLSQIKDNEKFKKTKSQIFNQTQVFSFLVVISIFSKNVVKLSKLRDAKST